MKSVRRSYLFATWSVLLLAASAQADTSCAIAKDAVQIAARLRGLAVKDEVVCKLKDRRAVEAYLRETIATKIPAKRLEYEGRIFKLLGVIPFDFNYREGIIKLYTDQLGGYYDPDQNYYAMAAWLPEMMQMSIAVHELTHALQDQHFVLDGFLDQQDLASDYALARSALVEGDASAVMIDYARELMGQPGISQESTVSPMLMQNITGAMFTTSLQQAPPVLQALLIFPYISGLNFAHALLRQGGYPQVDKAFLRLPSSTEEILHPEKYLRGKHDYIENVTVKLPQRLEGNQPVHADRMGEFFLSALLGSFIGPKKATLAAAGWGGDQIALFDVAGSKVGALVWSINWDSEQDATQFFDAAKDYLSSRFGQPGADRSGIVSFSSKEVPTCEIHREGQMVTLSFFGMVTKD